MDDGITIPNQDSFNQLRQHDGPTGRQTRSLTKKMEEQLTQATNQQQDQDINMEPVSNTTHNTQVTDGKSDEEDDEEEAIGSDMDLEYHEQPAEDDNQEPEEIVYNPSPSIPLRRSPEPVFTSHQATPSRTSARGSHQRDFGRYDLTLTQVIHGGSRSSHRISWPTCYEAHKAKNLSPIILTYINTIITT